MAGKVLNIKVCSPLGLHHGQTATKPAICHYSYNLPFRHIQLKLTKIPTCSALPVFWKMCLNAALNQIAMNALPIARNSYLNVANTCQNMVAKRNLDPPLRAKLPLRASSHGIALSAELRLARR